MSTPDGRRTLSNLSIAPPEWLISTASGQVPSRRSSVLGRSYSFHPLSFMSGIGTNSSAGTANCAIVIPSGSEKSTSYALPPPQTSMTTPISPLTTPRERYLSVANLTLEYMGIIMKGLPRIAREWSCQFNMTVFFNYPARSYITSFSSIITLALQLYLNVDSLPPLVLHAEFVRSL